MNFYICECELKLGTDAEHAFSIRDSSTISWSDDDSACDFTDRFQKCCRKPVEELTAEDDGGSDEEGEEEEGEEQQQQPVDTVASVDEDGGEGRTTTTTKRENNKQTSPRAKAEAAAPVKVGV